MMVEPNRQTPHTTHNERHTMDTVHIHIDGNGPDFSDTPWLVSLDTGTAWLVTVCVWADSCEDALEEAAEWASENCKGALWEPDYEDACNEHFAAFDQKARRHAYVRFLGGALSEERTQEICELAEQDLMQMDCGRFIGPNTRITEIHCAYAAYAMRCAYYAAVEAAEQQAIIDRFFLALGEQDRAADAA